MGHKLIDALKQIAKPIANLLGLGGPPIPRQPSDEVLARLVKEAAEKEVSLPDATQWLRNELYRLQLAPRFPFWARQLLAGFLGIIFLVALTASLWWLHSRSQQHSEDVNGNLPSAVTFLGEGINWLPADGQSKIELVFGVLDQGREPVPNVDVNFELFPPRINSAFIQTQSTTTDSMGRAVATLIAGRIAGEVQVQACLKKSTVCSELVSVGITALPVAELIVVLDKTALPDRLKVGNKVEFIFIVRNKGDAQADDVKFYSHIPAGTTFDGADDGCMLNAIGVVACDVGQLSEARGEAKRRFTVTASQGGTITLTAEDYWVLDAAGASSSGSETVRISVEELSPASITVIADPSTLAANGESKATIMVKVLDEAGELVAIETPVTFMLEPTGMGSIVPETDITTDGQVTATFAAGTTSGQVNLAVTVGDLPPIIAHLTLVEIGTTNRQYHLYASPNSEDEEVIIFQLPSGTLLELFSEVENGFQRVAVSIWVPEVIVNKDDSTIDIGAGAKQIAVGEGPEDHLNSSSAIRQILSRVNGSQVQVLDATSISGWVKVRLVGWFPEDYISKEGS